MMTLSHHFLRDLSANSLGSFKKMYKCDEMRNCHGMFLSILVPFYLCIFNCKEGRKRKLTNYSHASSSFHLSKTIQNESSTLANLFCLKHKFYQHTSFTPFISLELPFEFVYSNFRPIEHICPFIYAIQRIAYPKTNRNGCQKFTIDFDTNVQISHQACV